MSEALSVYWGNRLVGRLWTDERSSLRFQYDSSWLSTPGTSPISLRLPLQQEPFDSDHARTFFANLLPEADVRTRIARGLGVSESNDFNYLKNCAAIAGALTLLPSASPKCRAASAFRLMNSIA